MNLEDATSQLIKCKADAAFADKDENIPKIIQRCRIDF